jgi:tight adherence protein C
MEELTSPVVVAAVCVALALGLLGYSLLSNPEAARRRTMGNLTRGLSTRVTQVEPAQSGLVHTLAQVSRRTTPSPWLGLLDRWHSRAGRPAAWPMDRVLALKVLMLVLGAALALLLWTSDPQPRRILLGVFTVVLFWAIPDLLLLNRGIKRRDEIALALPDVMDQLSIAVEAGLGFESALNHVARNSEGPLAEELIRTLQDMQVGVPRRVAYQELGGRTDVTDLRRFCRAIIQAEEHGISVARVLQTQAADLRLKRRQRAEETAMKIPVKVIFPLLLCIMPALFVVILGPAVINLVDTFSTL